MPFEQNSNNLIPDWITPDFKSIREVFGDSNAARFTELISSERGYTPVQALEKIVFEPTILQTQWFRESGLRRMADLRPEGSNVINIGGSAVETASFLIETKMHNLKIASDNFTVAIFFLRGILTLAQNFEVADSIKILSKNIQESLASCAEIINSTVYSENWFFTLDDLMSGETYAHILEVAQEATMLANRFRSEVDLEYLTGFDLTQINQFWEEIAFMPFNNPTEDYAVSSINISDVELNAILNNSFPMPESESQLEKLKEHEQLGLLFIDYANNKIVLNEDIFAQIKIVGKANILFNPVGFEQRFDDAILNNVLMHYPSQSRRVILANLLRSLNDGALISLEKFKLGRTDDLLAQEYHQWITNNENYKDLGLELIEGSSGERMLRYNAAANLWESKDVKILNAQMVLAGN